MGSLAIKKWWFSACFKSLLIPSFFLLPFCALAQQKTISGKVKNDNGNVVPDISVTVKGKPSVGTKTDENGNYQIQAASGDILIFSAAEFTSVEQRVGSDNVIDISLSAQLRSMDEVVVVGYGTMAKKNITTAIAKIDPKDVPQAANSSLSQLVFGRAAGVNAVQQSAEPGGNIQISIRGRNYDGNHPPLIIVDGIVFPYSPLEPGNSNIATELNGVRRGGFAGINPDDIESIEFLKDASASIYGVNAANGVVLITTKRGKSGKISVSYDGSRSLVKNNKYLVPLTASEYMFYYNQLTRDKALFDGKQGPYGTNPPGTFTPKYSATDIQNAGEGTDWLGLVLRNGAIDNHNVSINGGSEKVVYYVSGGYFKEQGTMRNSQLERFTGRGNIAFNFTKWLSVNANVSGSKANFLNSTAGWQNGGSGTQGFGALQAALAYPRSVPVYDATGKYTLFQITGNPVSLLDIDDKTYYNSLNTTLSADFKILKNELTGRLVYGNSTENTVRDFFIPSTTFYFQLYRSRGSWNEANRKQTTMEALLMYKKTLLKDKLNLDVLTGIGQYQNDSYGFGAASADMPDGIGTDNLFAGTGAVTVASYRGYDKKRSYFGRATFDLFDKYVVQLSARYDGYSQFFPQNKYAFFPSASVAWKLSNESFLRNVEFINLLKLRASIGVTGEASGYAYLSYGPDNSLISFNSGATAIIPNTLTQLSHPELQWPKTVNENIGLDFSILKDRIGGSLDLFKDDLTRLLNNNGPTAPLSFFATQPVNGAHRTRSGWEVNINSKNVVSKDFQWGTTINVSHVIYKHVERFNFESLTPGSKINDPVSSTYVFKTDGILQVGEQLTSWQAALPARGRLPGNPKLVDINGDKKLDVYDIVRYNTSPTLTLGIGNTITYRNFDFAFFFYGQMGAYGINTLRSWASPAGFIAGNQSGIQELKNVWSNTNQTGTIPGIAYDQASLGLPVGLDVDLQKTDFIRCRNIMVGYSFKQPVINKIFKSLRLYVDVQNPFIITNFKIADPEVQAVGVKGGPAPYPVATTYSIGVKTSL